jgi:peptide-N4-(N-acetyl-beta-glucosaminyl)asparagine amidase
MEITVRLRSRMTVTQQHESEDRDRAQATWKGDEALRWREAEKAELGGRVSGPEDWRAARDELGQEQDIVIPEYKGKDCSTCTSYSLWLILVLQTISVPRAVYRGHVLTDKPDQVGHVFPPERIPRDKSWKATLKFRLTAPPGQAGADGMAIFFASEQRVGLGGYGLGYSGVGTTGDFAVEGQLLHSGTGKS